MISFRVPAVPIAQPRQRHRMVSTGGKFYAHNYTPTKHPVNEFKATVKLAFVAAYHGPPLEGALGFKLAFVMPRTKQMTWKTKPMPRVHRCGGHGGDWDNISKAVCDALNGLAFKDDKQIASAHVDLYVAGGDEQPHVEVEIWRLENDDA